MFLIHACTFESKKKKKLRVKYIGVLFDELSYYPDYPQGEDEEWSSKKNKLKKTMSTFQLSQRILFFSWKDNTCLYFSTVSSILFPNEKQLPVFHGEEGRFSSKDRATLGKARK